MTAPNTGTNTGTRILVTCEHGGNRIPLEYRPLFVGHEELLHSHGRSDPGALVLARRRVAQYVSAELEVNQRHVAAGRPAWRTLRENVIGALIEAQKEAEPRLPASALT